MKSLSFVARFIYGMVMILFGFNHFKTASELTLLVPESIPFKLIFVYVTGLALMAAGLSIIINKKAQLSMLLLGVMFIVFALTIHLPASSSDAVAMSNLLKDIALAGSAWFMAAHSED